MGMLVEAEEEVLVAKPPVTGKRPPILLIPYRRISTSFPDNDIAQRHPYPR